MNPSKRARVEAQVAEWLRYGDDLGLGPFYRDRASSTESLQVSDLDAATVAAAVDVAADTISQSEESIRYGNSAQHSHVFNGFGVAGCG